MSLKNLVTLPRIDPGTVRQVAQRLNHYATPGPTNTYVIKYENNKKKSRLCIACHGIEEVQLSYFSHTGRPTTEQKIVNGVLRDKGVLYSKHVIHFQVHT
jgi:hypothetical protein